MSSTEHAEQPLLKPASRLGTEAYASITPHDQYNLVYISFVLLGAGFLFPWNSVITAVGYFNSLFPNQGIEFDFTVCYMCPNLFGLIFVVRWGDRFQFFGRIAGGFLIFLVCILAIPFIKIKWLSLFIVCILGLSDAIVQGSIYGLAGQFHPRYVGAVMAGNGVAGVTVCALRIVTKLMIPRGPNSDVISTAIYFALSGLVILVCVAMYWGVISKSPVTKYYLQKDRATRTQYLSRLSAQGDQPLSVSGAAGYVGNVSHVDVEKAGLTMASDAPAASHGADASAPVIAARGPVAVLQDVKDLAFAAFANFFVTLALFPGITSEFVSSHFTVSSGWFPIILITLFNVTDLIGRTIPRWDALIVVSPKRVWIWTVVRIVFIPLFLLCLKPKVMSAEWMYPIMIVFGLTNGYLGTLAMMFSGNRVGVADKEQAGTVMVFFLTVGLTAGVWMGVVLDNMVQAGTL